MLPIYYQGAQVLSPVSSSVALLAFQLALGASALGATVMADHTHVYRPHLLLAWCLILMGLGLMSTVNEVTSFGVTIAFHIFIGIGLGTVRAMAHNAVLRPLPIPFHWPATTFLVYLRTYSQVIYPHFLFWDIYLTRSLSDMGYLPRWRRVPERLPRRVASSTLRVDPPQIQCVRARVTRCTTSSAPARRAASGDVSRAQVHLAVSRGRCGSWAASGAYYPGIPTTTHK